MATIETSTQAAAKRWASEYPELGSEPIPVEPLVSPRYFELEKERLFKRVWLNVGHLASDCPSPGEYFVKEIEACDASVLVIHGRDGKVRAFHNVCSHRGNRLVYEQRGKAKNYLTCNFHGWTYDLEGRLAGVMDEGGFADLDKPCLGLTPLATDTWKGLIFVNFDPEPAETLASYLGPLIAEFEDRPLERVQRMWHYQVVEDANWKVAMDAQNELYHLPILGPVHAAVADLYTMSEEGYARFTTFKRFGPLHTLWGTAQNPEFEPSGLMALLFAKAPPPKLEMPTRGGIFDYYVLFPNTVLVLLADQVVHYNFWPEAHDRVRWDIFQYVVEPETAAELWYAHYWKAKIRDVVSEDIASHEMVHAGLAQRAKRTFVLQDEEIQIRNFHKAVHSYVDPAEVGA